MMKLHTSLLRAALAATVASVGAAGIATAQGVAPEGANRGEVVRPATGNPGVDLNQVGNATGAVRMIDTVKREVTLDNGQTYKIATNVDIATVAQGQRYTFQYNLEGTERLVIKIDPPLQQGR